MDYRTISKRLLLGRILGLLLAFILFIGGFYLSQDLGPSPSRQPGKPGYFLGGSEIK